MNSQYNQPYISNSNIHKETNTRIYNRNVPSQILQPYLDVRPVMTKYSHFPIVDPRKTSNVQLQQIPQYNVNNVFNPGNSKAPWSGFASNINRESELRNQIYALQKSSQSVYVPNSNSDLYEYKFKTIQQVNPHELLSYNEGFTMFNPNPDPETVGTEIFYNHTRGQIRGLTKQNN
jgi:hypothetical protein